MFPFRPPSNIRVQLCRPSPSRYYVSSAIIISVKFQLFVCAVIGSCPFQPDVIGVVDVHDSFGEPSEMLPTARAEASRRGRAVGDYFRVQVQEPAVLNPINATYGCMLPYTTHVFPRAWGVRPPASPPAVTPAPEPLVSASRRDEVLAPSCSPGSFPTACLQRIPGHRYTQF